MKKTWLFFVALALFSVAPFSFATNNLENKYLGSQYQPAGKSISLKMDGAYATEILVLNNTLDAISVEVPYTGVSDWLSANRVYRITSATIFPKTNVRLWHPDFGYFDNFVSNHSIISFAIEYGRANVIAVEYH